MLSKFKPQTLKQKLWAIVAASFVARVIMFFVLPNTPSSLGPDEATYASLAKWIGESNSAVEFPAYGEGLYLSSRAMIVPASLLYRIGIEELEAVRIVSTIYGLFALILVVALIVKLNKQNGTDSLNRKSNNYIIVGLVSIFAFLPSHFIWSNLGLRESATEFWLLSTFIVFFLTFQFRKSITFPTLLFLFGSIVLTFSARPQVGWVLGISLIIFLLLNLKNPITYFLIPAVLCGILFGSFWNLGSAASGTESRETLASAFKPITTAGKVVSHQQEVNQIGAASAIETQSCPKETPTALSTSPKQLDTYFCIAWRAPYMISTFLFRPIVGLDVTSTSSLIAAVENIFWFFFFVTIFTLGIKRRAVTFIAPILPAVVFLVLYVLGASAYQGNMGTGFRHKSLILWVVLLLIFALAWREPKETSKKLGNNSQESAV